MDCQPSLRRTRGGCSQAARGSCFRIARGACGAAGTACSARTSARRRRPGRAPDSCRPRQRGEIEVAAKTSRSQLALNPKSSPIASHTPRMVSLRRGSGAAWSRLGGLHGLVLLAKRFVSCKPMSKSRAKMMNPLFRKGFSWAGGAARGELGNCARKLGNFAKGACVLRRRDPAGLASRDTNKGCARIAWHRTLPYAPPKRGSLPSV